jgi:hypothetical protein
MIERNDECDNQPYNWRVGSTPQLSMKAGTTNIARHCMLQTIASVRLKKGTYTHNHLAADCGCMLGFG